MNEELLEEFLATKIRENLTLGFFSHEMAKIGVYVVSPGETTSLVWLSDNSRFFPEINEDDIVVGGYFG